MRKDKKNMQNLKYSKDYYTQIEKVKKNFNPAKIIKFYSKRKIKIEPQKVDIAKKWEEFLKKRNLTIEEYNKNVIESKKIKKENSFLKNASTKKELKLLIQARNIADTVLENTKEKHPQFHIDEEAQELLTLEVFEKLKPEINKGEYFKAEDKHFGNYYSRDVYAMIAQSDPWYVASHEYYRMNINDNADEISRNDTKSNTLNGYRLKDIIETTTRKFRP